MAEPLHTDLLRRVSRSFYLSMRLLPTPMRDPVSLGYLLARASDTLADTAAVPVGERRRALAVFRRGLEEGVPPPGELAEAFGPRQSHAGEAELLRRLPECWDWLGALGEPHRRAVREVLAEITAGQDWDLERFGEAGRESPACCRTAAELDAYTYRVAGCVGEFWTRVGLMSLGGRFAPAEAEAELLVSGRSLGQGLQLVNILRDLGADLEAGRCYLPEEELIAAGWREGRREAALAAVAAAWRTRCREALRPGWSYVARLRRGRARVATALPLILAEKTLDALEAAGDGVILGRRVKVTRGAVWAAMARALVA